MDEPQLSAALQAEYLHLQKTIEDFDGRVLTIKAWSVTFGLVTLAGAFGTQVKPVFLIASMGSALFWYLETKWKVFQLAYYTRSEQIEKHFRTQDKLTAPFQIGTSWYKRWQKISVEETIRIAFWPHVLFPHAFVIVGGLALYVFALIGRVLP